jgi:hypothetical protein
MLLSSACQECFHGKKADTVKQRSVNTLEAAAQVCDINQNVPAENLSNG